MNLKIIKKNEILNIIKSKEKYYSKKKYFELEIPSKILFKIKIYTIIILLILIIAFFLTTKIKQESILTKGKNKYFQFLIIQQYIY